MAAIVMTLNDLESHSLLQTFSVRFFISMTRRAVPLHLFERILFTKPPTTTVVGFVNEILVTEERNIHL